MKSIARYVDLAERHTGLLLAAGALLAVATLLPVSRLELHTDMAEILPAHHPAGEALDRVSKKQRSSSNLAILIESPDVAASDRFVAALKPELERLVPSIYSEVQWEPDSEVPAFANRWRWLYADKADLEQANALLDRLIATRRSPLFVDLEGDPEAELRTLRKRLDAAVPSPPKPGGFVGSEGATHYRGVLMWRRSGGYGSAGDFETLEATKAAVARANPGPFDPRIKVEYTGMISMAIDEHNAVRDDLTLATSLCFSLVLIAIYLYFRRVALLFVIGIPAVLGLLLALALARFTLHALNANTAFLISIILGNGINTPIILLARYGEERREGRPVAAALTTAMSATLRATLTATTAASIAYGCLLLTSLRALNQFGLVGGAGMILVWLATYLLVPPLVLFGERHWPGRLTPRASAWRPPFAALGRYAEQYPRRLGALALLLVAIALPPLSGYLRDPLEWNFGNLRSAETDGMRRWHKMYEIGMGSANAGYIATDGVIIVDDPSQTKIVADALWEKDRALGSRHVLKAVRTLDTMLPSAQTEKLALLDHLRRDIDKNIDLVRADERAEILGWRPPDDLHVIGIADLPRRVLDNFTEVDGTRGRLIGVDAEPAQFVDMNGRELPRLARGLAVDALGTHWVAASQSTVFAAMIELMLSDWRRVTLAALGAVALLVTFMFGLRGALPVLASLGVGLLWMGGVLALMKLKINFVNFVGVSITLGVGADYAANIWARLRREGSNQLGRVIADTGSAVALCSTTTIIGYSSLLLAGNRALKSFGLLADVGEVTCLLAALVALPVLVKLALPREPPQLEPLAEESREPAAASR